MTYSKTYIGAIAALLGGAFAYFGTPFAEGEIEKVIEAALIIYGFIQTLIGRYNAGGVTMGGFRKQ